MRVIATPLRESIVERTRQIDNLLFKLGGSGRNMHERVQSVRSRLDANDARQLGHIIAVNRRMVLGNRFRIERDHHRFIAACEWLIVRLEDRLASGPTGHHRIATRENATASKSVSIAAASLLLIVFIALYTKAVDYSEWVHWSIQHITGLPFLIAILVATFVTTRFVAKHR